MLTQIRHIQKGTLIVVTILIVIAFAFLYSDFDFSEGSLGSQNCVVKVYDRCYRLKEVQKLASYYDVANQLGMGEFSTALFGETRRDDDRSDFVMRLIVLRREAEKMGIEPSAADIKAEIPKLPIFQQPFVTAAFLENNILGPNGFSDGDLAQLVKDYISFQKLRDLIGVGLVSIPAESDKLYVRANQRYTASLISFDRESVTDDVKITDEEIQSYYDENAENLLSESRRAFKFAKFEPKELPEDATQEQRAKAEQAFLNGVNHAYADLAEDGADFGGIAKALEGDKADFKVTSGSFKAFGRSEAPEEIAEEGRLLDSIFSGALQENGVTVPLSVGKEGAYYVFLIEKIEEPRPLTLEEATKGIRSALESKNSNQVVSDAANAARAAINEALAAGKSFEEATKVAGVSAEALPNFSSRETPSDLENAALIVGAVSELGENELSEVIELPGGKGFLLVHVDKIELYEDEEEETTKRSIGASVETGLRYRLYTAWFNQRAKESGASRGAMSGALR